MRKEYRFSEGYLEKINEIKVSIQSKKEYEKIVLNDTDVIKIIIDNYHQQMNCNQVSEKYIQQISDQVISKMELQLNEGNELLRLSSEHFDKVSLINQVLLNFLLEVLDVGMNNVNQIRKMKFLELAKEIENEKRKAV